MVGGFVAIVALTTCTFLAALHDVIPLIVDGLEDILTGRPWRDHSNDMWLQPCVDWWVLCVSRISDFQAVTFSMLFVASLYAFVLGLVIVVLAPA